jgi:orotidine-5'-phosphate decarboxylase
MSFADRLAEAVRQKGPLCVGIDPRWDLLPAQFRNRSPHDPPEDRAAIALRDFGLKILDLVEPFSNIIKPQAAFFELFGPEGMWALQAIIQEAREREFVTILDAKRGDIASTATAYAEAAFGGAVLENEQIPVWDADALTVNPYLGEDAVEPFISAARKLKRGLFVLVRTSNPGGSLFQNLMCEGQPLYWHVAQAVKRWNEPGLGTCELGDVGAVVGATHPRELAEIRSLLPKVWFLVPGYGAQGGTAADVKAGFLPNGLGAIVNSSRGITFPFQPDDPDWEQKVIAAAERAATELR